MFNWAVKKFPYSFAVVLPSLLWTIVVAGVCGGSLVLARADFELTGTRDIFLLTLTLCISTATLLLILELVFNIGLKGKEWKILNQNIIKGNIRPDVSDQTLLKIYGILGQIDKWLIGRDIQYTTASLFILVLVEWLTGHYFKNVFIVFIGGSIAILWSIIGAIVFYELFTAQARRECKILLAKRNLSFKEEPLFTLKLKSRMFIFLLFMLLIGILVLIPSLSLNLIIFSFVLLFIIMILNDSLFRTIYNAFFNIKEAAMDLAKGEKTFFFSGSRDEEIIDLTQNLSIAAKKIYEARETLEESKSILEIKVKSRTEELQKLAENLDKQVKERTEELQRKVKELEKFQKFATGREIKMVELKKEIKELKEELKKLNIKE